MMGLIDSVVDSPIGVFGNPAVLSASYERDAF